MELDKKMEQFKSVFTDLEEVDIDKIKTDGMSLRIGGKLVIFKSIEENPITVEEEIRQELRVKINSQQKIIRDKINKKISEMMEYHNQVKREYKRKEQKLEQTLANSVSMPEVTLDHAQRGLSVLKGNRGEIIWLVQGIYWPKSVDDKPIEKKFSKKMISNVIFLIKTNGNNVLGVSTRQPIGLDYFEHYHQSKPDCWGHWKYPKRFNGPDDILKIAKDAEAVLENINTGSIASSSPRGLPRKATVLKHITTKYDENPMGALNQQVRRSGITETVRSNDMDVWSL